MAPRRVESPQNQRLKLAGAAILVFQASMSLQAVSAAYMPDSRIWYLDIAFTGEEFATRGVQGREGGS